MSTTKPAKSTLARQSRAPKKTKVSSSSGLRGVRFSPVTLIVLASVLALGGIAYVLLSFAGSKPYSRLDCTAANQYKGVSGAQVNPPIAGYSSRPNKQACLDQSSEAMTAKIYKAVTGNNIAANPSAYIKYANQYIGYRSNPPVQFADALLKAANLQSMSPEARVGRLYAVLLGSDPDAVGKKYWVSYLKRNGGARTIVAFLNNANVLRSVQSFSNGTIATLPASYRPEASTCGHGLNEAECLAYVKLLRQANSQACPQATGISVATTDAANGVDSKGLAQIYNSDGKPTNKIQLCMVQGIRVSATIALSLNNMINAARAKQIVLGGIGWRSYAQQKALRAQNGCPSAKAAASSCRIPTAIPGTSNHEKGEAVDFNNSATRSTTVYRWLKTNAARYRFYNLPSEPWHWSRTGH